MLKKSIKNGRELILEYVSESRAFISYFDERHTHLHWYIVKRSKVYIHTYRYNEIKEIISNDLNKSKHNYRGSYIISQMSRLQLNSIS